MHSFKPHSFLLLGLVLALPACFKIESGDDDSSGGDSGKGGTTSTGGSSATGGSSGSGGSVGLGGSTATGGSSGSSAAGTGGTSGAASDISACVKSGFTFPNVTCPSNGVSQFANPGCQAFYLCLGVEACTQGDLDCAECIDYLQGQFDGETPQDVCLPAGTSQSTLTQACVTISEDSTENPFYPLCEQ